MGCLIFETHTRNEALRLCKERKRLIKLAVDSRHALTASHVSYIQSLRNIGTALRRYAEAEVLLESPLSVSNTITTPSPSPSHVDDDDDVLDSPLHSESHVISCMRSRGTEAVTLRIKPCGVGGFNSKNEENLIVKNARIEREDPSEFITHTAKDFLSSVKDIEHRFFRAFESGREVSRMLEADKIVVGYSDAKGKSSAMDLLKAFQSVFRGGKAIHVSKGPSQKIISWRRIVPSQSSLFRNPSATTSKEDIGDSECDFVEESCMVSGSHSCTLDRLYAWETKLYDEVKACESIRKEYDRKCDQLRRQFAKDQGTQVIDKTRSVVRNLHSQIIVAICSFDSISKQIERVRDEELLPQLLELNQGLIRMWRAMLECHHAQFITMSLAYHSRGSKTGTLEDDTRKEILAQLLEEFKCFSLSFDTWINSHTSYVEALNEWLQNCILQPRKHSKRRRMPFSPRRVIAPTIFVLCRDWSVVIKDLPSDDLSKAMKNFVSSLSYLVDQHDKELQEKQNLAASSTGETKISNTNDDDEDDFAHLSCIHASLTKVLCQLTKFSEASLKIYEDIRHKSEAAQAAYYSCKFCQD